MHEPYPVQPSTPAQPLSAPAMIVPAPAPGRQTVWWVMTVILAVIATTLILRWDDTVLGRRAMAQSAAAGSSMAGARGIYAFTGQLTAKSYGLFMLDVDSGTVWCYEFQHGANGEPQMKLVAARSWIYDRYLEEFNAADPVPSAVKSLVEQQQAGRSAASSSEPAAPAGPAVLPGGNRSQ